MNNVIKLKGVKNKCYRAERKKNMPRIARKSFETSFFHVITQGVR